MSNLLHEMNGVDDSETVSLSQNKSTKSTLIDAHATPTNPLELSSSDFISRILQEQQQLTAVEQFSRAESYGQIPAQAKHYSKLIPISQPKSGQQFGFEVSLDDCSGCKACVTACHSLNGLDEQETWRDVGLLMGGTSKNPVMQHVTTACHHCLEPACMTACPVNAYEKHLVTGIVKHLDDQCIGCQYCTLACPYDVPKYHRDLGIVRKCDMCSDRLAANEAPACVQACPHNAIQITIVDVQEVYENSEVDFFLPAAPEPHLTYPTTIYKSKRVFPRNMLPADYLSVNPQHPHWPLIIMLVLTQLSVGAFTVGMILSESFVSDSLTTFHSVLACTALLFGILALTSSLFHLGRPFYAFRAILGLGHSWLSREILAFGVFAATAGVHAAATLSNIFPPEILKCTGYLTMITGLAGVFCSAMIYVVTNREFWKFFPTMTRFLLTSAILGIAATWLSLLLLGLVFDAVAADQFRGSLGLALLKSLVLLSIGKLVFEAVIFRHLFNHRMTPLKRTALLMVGPLSNSTFARFAVGLLGGIAMPLLLINQIQTSRIGGVTMIMSVAMIFCACLTGELIERFQFFAAVSSPRMPGNVRR